MGVERGREGADMALTIAEPVMADGQVEGIAPVPQVLGPGLLERIAATIEGSLTDSRDQFLVRAARELQALDPVSRLELGRAVTLAAEALLRDALARLETAAPPPVELPPAVLWAARLWARAGQEASALIGACSVGDEYFWDQFERTADALASDGGSVLEAQRRAQRELAEYADRTQLLLRAAFDEEQSAVAADADTRRALLVRQVIDGVPPSTAALGYELAQNHIAVIAWDGPVATACEALKERFGRNVLSCTAPDGALWLWIGSRGPLGAEDVLGIAEATIASGCQTALGEPGSGPDGFRRSHRQALLARAAATTNPSSSAVTRYDEVAAVALLTSCDPTAARELVEHELAGLLESDSRTHELRRTLRAHLAESQRTSATGRAMGIDRHTVRERLDEIERRLGRSIEGRSTDLAIALALHSAAPNADASADGDARTADPS
jgi:hypothetical protein